MLSFLSSFTLLCLRKSFINKQLEAMAVEPLFGWHLSVTHKTVYARWIGKAEAPGATAYFAHLRFLWPAPDTAPSAPAFTRTSRARTLG
jgi:hypothetical protein